MNNDQTTVFHKLRWQSEEGDIISSNGEDDDPEAFDICTINCRLPDSQRIEYARLIAAAPALFSFVASKSNCGDAEAMKIINQITNERA